MSMSIEEIRDSEGRLVAKLDPASGNVCPACSDPPFEVHLETRDWLVLSPGSGLRITIIRTGATEFTVTREEGYRTTYKKLGGAP